MQQADGQLDCTLHILEWFSTTERVLFYLAIRAVHDVVVPWFNFAAVVMVKRCIVGKFKIGKRDNSGGWGTFRHWIMAQLLPTGTLCGVTILCGKHYEMCSRLLRLLGAKIGKRV